MSIRIDLNNSALSKSVGSVPLTNRAETWPSVIAPGPDSVSGDTVNLSQISGLVAKALGQPEVRMDKVQAIKAQIGAGSYEVNPSMVADAIINFALDREI